MTAFVIHPDIAPGAAYYFKGKELMVAPVGTDGKPEYACGHYADNQSNPLTDEEQARIIDSLLIVESM